VVAKEEVRKTKEKSLAIKIEDKAGRASECIENVTV